MMTNTSGRWGPRITTLLVWALVAGSLTLWWLRLAVQAPPAPPVAAAAPVAPPSDPAALARALGVLEQVAEAPAPAPAEASRFALLGVVMRRHNGAALIAIDGKPAKPFRVGAKVDEGLVLQSVSSRSAVLAAAPDGPPRMTLELPPRRP